MSVNLRGGQRVDSYQSFWVEMGVEAMASKCHYKAYLTKSTGTSFIQDEIE